MPSSVPSMLSAPIAECTRFDDADTSFAKNRAPFGDYLAPSGEN